MRSNPRGSLEPHLPQAPLSDEEMGVVVIRLADVRDDWVWQALINEAIRLYGRREMA